MQGINKAKHAHLIDALLQTERQLSRNCECLQEAEEYRTELESMYNSYEHMLDELAKQIMRMKHCFARLRSSFSAKRLNL